ncbi:hypothetical protein NDU88_005947 [Pleurodeles waltl]|uniref:Uncharacterized protein n=1 Tax=Pleurodeles waltl TaxID=8319 RepID=A0AAV7UKG2_PLEWA|nr:hypothetical protein NDU88_005947 [Pleurodeles waltl]
MPHASRDATAREPGMRHEENATVGLGLRCQVLSGEGQWPLALQNHKAMSPQKETIWGRAQFFPDSP